MLSNIFLLSCKCIPFEKLKIFFSSLTLPVLEPEIVIQYSAIIAGFISITIPIALSIVSRQTEVYKDSEISADFLKNWRYRFQLYGVLFIVFSSIIVFALKLDNNILNWLIITLDAFTMFAFILFMRLVQKYAIDVEEYLSRKIKNDSDEIVR